MAAKLPTWQVGDAVYSLRLDPTTGRHRVHGEGRVVRIEGGTLHLQSTKGPKTWAATSWPAFKTRAEGEAYVAEHSRPGGNRGGDSRLWAKHVRGPGGAATRQRRHELAVRALPVAC